jgi:thiamine pyrophosphokinase
MIICADGGANSLFNTLNKEERKNYLPSVIVGDLYSLDSNV